MPITVNEVTGEVIIVIETDSALYVEEVEPAVIKVQDVGMQGPPGPAGPPGEGGGLVGLSALAPIVTTDQQDGTYQVSITAASTSAAGSMSAADKTKLDGSSSLNTASAIVQRDASGNFSAGTVSAALTGTASNASALNNQPGTHYLARANHTGTQSASSISDFDAQVRTNRLDQLAAPTLALSLNSQRITNLATPSATSDAATKGYADTVAQNATLTAGDGLSQSGSTLSVLGTSDRIAVSAAGVDIASSYLGQASISTLGTVTSGTWQGSPVALAYGGTGSTTAQEARTSLGAIGGNLDRITVDTTPPADPQVNDLWIDIS
jgi:hypothetical protein